MRQRKGFDACFSGDCSKEFVSRATRGVFEGKFPLGGKRCDVALLDGERQTVTPGQLPDKLGIGIAVRAAKLVIEMTDMRTQTTDNQHIQQRHGVRAAGDADKQRFAGREELCQCCSSFF